MMNKRAAFALALIALLMAIPLAVPAMAAEDDLDSGVFAIGSEQDSLSEVFSELRLQVDEIDNGPVKRATPTISIVDPFIDERIIKGNVKKVVVEYTGLDLNTCRFSACLSKLVKGPQELSGNIVYDFASGGAVFRAGSNRGEILMDTNNVANGTYYLWVMFSDSASNTTGYNRIPINILTNTAFGWYQQSNGRWSFMETDGKTWVSGAFRQIVYSGSLEYFYFDSNGYMVTGWQSINGKRYYFDSSGVMKRNGWVTVDGKQYYMDEDGASTTDGWISSDGRRYYLTGGNPLKGLQTVGGAQYIFEDSGALATGGKVAAGGKTYFANDDGTAYKGWKDKNYYMPEMAVGGFFSIDGGTYGFDNAGNVCENGLAQIGNDYYLFSGSVMQVGYNNVDGKSMYFIENGDNRGKRAKGPVYIGDKYLFFSDDGVRDDGTGERQAGGRYYYIINGTPQIGEYNGRLYGNDFAAVHGFHNAVFYEHGIKQVSKWVTYDGKQYLLDGEGKARKGWVKAGSSHYFLDNTTGAMLTGQWVKAGGKWYYLNTNGTMAIGWVKVDNKWYNMKSSGAMQTGWLQDKGKWYYLQSNGVMGTGWVKAGGGWYYMNSSGVMQTGWQKAGSQWYYMKASGAMATGWQRIGGKWYYLNPSSGAMATGTQTIGGKTYKFDSSGVWIS